MDPGAGSVDNRLDDSFLVVTGAFQIVFVCRLVYSGVRHRGYLLSAARSILKTMGRSFKRPKLADDERLVMEQVSQVLLFHADTASVLCPVECADGQAAAHSTAS
ncbi:unnamed protein product [Symbiodinium microadriaticum]|nr:unnamed protein product [Symbiodinium microadriaticum]